MEPSSALDQVIADAVAAERSLGAKGVTVVVDRPWGHRGTFVREYPPETRLETIRDEAVAFYRAQHENIGDGPHALKTGDILLALDVTLADLDRWEGRRSRQRRLDLPPFPRSVILVPTYAGEEGELQPSRYV